MNVTANLRVIVGQTFATVPMRKIRHTTMIGWGWVGRVGVRGVEVGGVGVGEVEVGGSGLGDSQFSPTPPTSTPLTPTLPTQPQPITVVWRIFHIDTVANVCPTVTLKFSVTFVCLTRCVANLPCGKSAVANLPCGESSGNPRHWSSLELNSLTH